jgi:hypothetical protein
MFSQQPIDTARRQLITDQQHHIIESALPIFPSHSHASDPHRPPSQIRSATPKVSD